MQKFILSLAFILISFGSVYSQETAVAEKIPPKTSEYIYQLSLGSAYSFYFPLVNTTIDLMDSSSLNRFPLSLDFLFGKKMSETIAWTVSLTTGMDIFFSSPDTFQLYTLIFTGGFQYIPFKTGLTMGFDAGFSILIPNTNLSYIGNTEIGSTVSLDLGYIFETLKFSKLGIVPGIGLKLIHSEMKHGSADQICGYINLGIR